MPELPEVEALATFLRERAVGRTVLRVDVAAINAVKTYDPPLSALNGAYVIDAGRHGKFLDLTLASEAAGEVLHLITHLSRAGWLQWRGRPGRSCPPSPPSRARAGCGGGSRCRPPRRGRAGRARSRSGCTWPPSCPGARPPAST